jgi:hypothetical protein
MRHAANVTTGLPVMRAVNGHHAGVPFYLTAAMYGGLPIEIAGGEMSGKVGQPVADTHTHDVDEIYLLLAPEPGGIVIDVEIDGVVTEVAGPATIHIPAGTPHRFVTTHAVTGSYCLGILLGAEGEPA